MASDIYIYIYIDTDIDIDIYIYMCMWLLYLDILVYHFILIIMIMIIILLLSIYIYISLSRSGLVINDIRLYSRDCSCVMVYNSVCHKVLDSGNLDAYLTWARETNKISIDKHYSKQAWVCHPDFHIICLSLLLNVRGTASLVEYWKMNIWANDESIPFYFDLSDRA